MKCRSVLPNMVVWFARETSVAYPVELCRCQVWYDGEFNLFKAATGGVSRIRAQWTQSGFRFTAHGVGYTVSENTKHSALGDVEHPKACGPFVRLDMRTYAKNAFSFSRPCFYIAVSSNKPRY